MIDSIKEVSSMKKMTIEKKSMENNDEFSDKNKQILFTLDGLYGMYLEGETDLSIETKRLIAFFCNTHKGFRKRVKVNLEMNKALGNIDSNKNLFPSMKFKTIDNPKMIEQINQAEKDVSLFIKEVLS